MAWDSDFGRKSPDLMISGAGEAFCVKCNRVLTLTRKGLFRVHSMGLQSYKICKNSGVKP